MNLFIILLLIIVAGYAFFIFTKLANLAKQHRDQETIIDATLKKRFDIFTRLIDTFKNGMDIEQSSLRQVPIMREQALAAQKINDQKTRIGLEDKISQIAGGISFIYEQHPKIKENPGAHDTHKELIKAEEELAHQKMNSNSLIDNYLKTNKGIIPLILNKIFANQLAISSERWQIHSEALEDRENYSVDSR